MAVMQWSIRFLLFVSFVYITDANYSACSRYVNKIYKITVTFPRKTSLYAIVRLLPHGVFDELFSIANGNNEDEVGANFALSNRVGYYRCPNERDMQLTGLGFLYKTEGVPFLKKNGAVVTHDYAFRFSNDGTSCYGKVQFAVFSCDANPFLDDSTPVFEGEVGTLTCELLKFRPYYELSAD